MNILVVDDERTFNFDCVYARTIAEAISNLYSGQTWDEVWLDHDLGSGKNGSFIADMVELDSYQGLPLSVKCFVIHSSNPVGREKMRQALSRFYSVRMVRAEDYQ